MADPDEVINNTGGLNGQTMGIHNGGVHSSGNVQVNTVCAKYAFINITYTVVSLIFSLQTYN